MKSKLSLPLHRRGFALIVTLSLMILLTVIAVGLLSLSTISLRSTSQGDAMQAAKANARLALMLAIGDLQKQLGPDTRISATADQATSGDGSVSTTPAAQRQWAGSYKSWDAAVPSAPRPEPGFLQWFVSGPPARVTDKAYAGTSIGTDPKTSVEIVTAYSVANSDAIVRVPLITQTQTNGTKNNYAWWVSDLGTKALIAPSKALPSAIGDVHADQQVPSGNNLKSALAGTNKPFAQLAVDDARLSKVVSWQSGALLADSPQNIRGLFHDFTTQNRGLLTNVRKGGFRKDLSMELERSAAPSLTNAAAIDRNVLYQVGGENGINLQELWAYYNLHTSAKVKRSGASNFTTGGRMSSGTPHFQLANGPGACQGDTAFFYKQPVVISYQLALSLQARMTPNAANVMVNRLHIVADPIITFWNPLDLPVVVPASSFFTVKFWQIPYDVTIGRNGSVKTYPLAASLSNASNANDGDSNFLSFQVGVLEPLAFKPGEVIKTSQVKNTIAQGSGTNKHRLGGGKGFNHGGGYALPLRDRSNNFIDINPTDTITYVRSAPNELTAGATTRSGRTIEADGTAHTRHFSLTHHEYYIGEDRENFGPSLGIGGMFIDYDFGNKRLLLNNTRGRDDPGTKAGTERLYANNSSLKDIFITLNSGKSIPAGNLTSKQPFMLLSFNAKTELSSARGTRTLSRFNPKALHVDFYNLSPEERDMLPYEYTVQGLDSWKSSDLLEVNRDGNGYFGGAMDATNGSSFVTTHSIPREPIVSLAAFQHSFANGFNIQTPKPGYGTLNAREPMLPQISHAIGNSMACPVLPANTTQGTLPGGRPLADHSYLANQSLWDDWFLSGITPQTTGSFSKSRSQKSVATDFLSADPTATKLPVSRYIADLRGQDSSKLINRWLPGSVPAPVASDEVAAFIRVDGMFNVNSTSVEAWKSLLGARKDRPVVVRDLNGRESVETGAADETPVAGLLSPIDSIAKGTGAVDPQSPESWIGRRVLSDPEIDQLARGIVKEIRKRGPFISLADFINRRVGNDDSLARAGAIQSALDSADVQINRAYNSGERAVGGAAGRFTFPKAEEGPLSYGSPGIVKQADILTPIAPILSARSDSFLIRGYGEKTDAAGKVIARAWCEAVIQRSPEFIDPADLPEKSYSTISNLNKTFGRRFDIVSFRWLNPLEA
ncbi:MAG: hypothetical protein WEB53_04240 [Akkermansiaceae bacterium]